MSWDDRKKPDREEDHMDNRPGLEGKTWERKRSSDRFNILFADKQLHFEAKRILHTKCELSTLRNHITYLLDQSLRSSSILPGTSNDSAVATGNHTIGDTTPMITSSLDTFAVSTLATCAAFLRHLSLESPGHNTSFAQID
jgi:hypothetical protein